MAESKSMESTKDDLLDINKLKYRMVSSTCLMEEGAVYKRAYADSHEYKSGSNNELVVQLTASSDYVYGPDSLLVFDVKADGLATNGTPCGIGFLNSPATALFSRFMLEDRSGVELERVDFCNRYVRNVLPFKTCEDYRRQIEAAGEKFSKGVLDYKTASNQQAIADFSLNNPAGASVGTGVYLKVAIPLWYFSGMFAEESLIPGQLISGARLRLSLESPSTALSIIGSDDAKVPATFTTNGVTYTIQNPYILMSTYSLQPEVQQILLQQQGSEIGLPYVYKSIFSQKSTPGAVSSAIQQVNKAVSRAVALYTVTQVEADPGMGSDSLGSGFTQPVFSYQCRIGDLYLPQQLIQASAPGGAGDQADTRRNCAELYSNSLQQSCSLKDPYRDIAVSLEDFRANYRPDGEDSTVANGGNSTLCQTLIQSPGVSDAGIAINNSRTCEIRLQFASGDVRDTAKGLYTFLEYYKLARVFPMRTVVAQ